MSVRLLAIALAIEILSTGSAHAEAPAVPTWTGDGYAIPAEPGLWPALDFLLTHNGSAVLGALNTTPTPVVWIGPSYAENKYGQFLPRANVIGIARVDSARPDDLAALIAHEATHLKDSLEGRLDDTSAESCYLTEIRAYRAETDFWIGVYGPDGRVAVENVLDEQLNGMASWRSYAPSADFDAQVRAHTTSCAQR